MKIEKQRFRLNITAYNAWYAAEHAPNESGISPDDEDIVIGDYTTTLQDGTPARRIDTFDGISVEVPQRFLTPISEGD